MNRNFFVVLVLGGAAGWFMWHIDRYQGCFSNEQTFELRAGKGRAIACNQADITFVDVSGSAPAIEVDCGDGPKRLLLFGASPQSAGCGYRVSALETWRDGNTGGWNTRLHVTWPGE